MQRIASDRPRNAGTYLSSCFTATNIRISEGKSKSYFAFPDFLRYLKDFKVVKVVKVVKVIKDFKDLIPYYRIFRRANSAEYLREFSLCSLNVRAKLCLPSNSGRAQK